MATVKTLTFGRVYNRGNTSPYEHSNQILHIPEINDTTSATFLSKYGFSASDRVLNLSVQLPVRCNTADIGKPFNNMRVVIFNKFTGVINNNGSASNAWFSHSSNSPDIDNMLIKWQNSDMKNSGFVKTAIDAGKLIGTPLAYFDTSFSFPSGTSEMNLTLNSSNSTITITDAGKNINNWAPTGYKVAEGHGLFIGFYNTAADFWDETCGYTGYHGLNWGIYNSSTATPYAYVNITTGSNIVRYFDGSSWKDCEVYYFDGSSWKTCEAYYYDGSSWKTIG